jgi:phytoene dehydrogenase-like protein
MTRADAGWKVEVLEASKLEGGCALVTRPRRGFHFTTPLSAGNLSGNMQARA